MASMLQIEVMITDQTLGEDLSECPHAAFFSELGHYGEVAGTELIEATFWCEGVEIGFAALYLIDREKCEDFHVSLHAERPNKLAEAGTLLFARDGETPRLGALRGLEAASTGGFLFVEKFRLAAAKLTAPYDEAASGAWQALLQRLSGRWTVCVYFADAVPHLDAAEAVDAEAQRWGAENEADEERHFLALQRRRREDALAPLQVGFAQAVCDTRCEELYLATPNSAETGMTAEQARTVTIEQQVFFRCHVHSLADVALRKVMDRFFDPREAQPVMQYFETDEERTERLSIISRVVAELERCVKNGASVAGSFVLHTCAMMNDARFIDELVALDEPLAAVAAVDTFDEDGLTPLMHAGANATSTATNDFMPNVGVIVKLVKNGASKDLADARGLTALGHYRKATRKAFDNVDDFGHGRLRMWNEKAARAILETLLWPKEGPTLADEEWLDDRNEPDVYHRPHYILSAMQHFKDWRADLPADVVGTEDPTVPKYVYTRAGLADPTEGSRESD